MTACRVTPPPNPHRLVFLIVVWFVFSVYLRLLLVPMCLHRSVLCHLFPLACTVDAC